MIRYAGLLLLASCSASAAPRAATDVDLAREGEAAVALLREMLRIDTTNPPPPGAGWGGESALCRRVQALLAEDGIASEIYEPVPGRGNLVARLRGSGAKKPLMLMAHIDVVGVERERWSADPLGGEIRDGFLWGRGALDDKDDAAVMVQVMRILARTRPALERDVILMLNGDEESSGTYGARWMVEKHWDKIACELVISEGGRTALRGDRIAQVELMTAEKVYVDLKVWVRGVAGHSSVPIPLNAVYGLSKILAALETHKTPVRVMPAVAAYMAGLSDLPVYAALRGLLKKTSEGDLEAAEQLCTDPRWNAMLRTTVVPTMLRSGIRENVLPADAEANLNVRMLPGDDLEKLVASLMKHAGVERYELLRGTAATFEAWKKQPSGPPVAVFVADHSVDAPATPHDTEAYRRMEKVARALAPGAVVVPRLATGATDLRFLRMKGVHGFGISPCPTGEDEERTVHGHDERVRVDSVKFGVRFVHDLVLALAGT
ncbi:MAG TPA: M20/M25/M40 family metallo-hydrolase [Planctomycetota bacterium]|nr:M20/M25/M40 family metallo-hydrolase [Planctomycetota bacterium]